MKTRLMMASAAAALLASAAGAPAQTSTTTTTTTQTTVTNEQQSKIRAYVTRQKPASITAPSGFTVRSGATLPETVELETFPSDVGVTNYRYTVIGDRTVVVEPGTRRIVEVIE
jgi:hypothetical protein